MPLDVDSFLEFPVAATDPGGESREFSNHLGAKEYCVQASAFGLCSEAVGRRLQSGGGPGFEKSNWIWCENSLKNVIA